MGREINKQRCFQIPKEKLDLFLVKITMSNDNLLHVEADWIFDGGDHYDVVVNHYGSYPYVENELEKFAEELKTK